jgi:hypothetical protein
VLEAEPHRAVHALALPVGLDRGAERLVACDRALQRGFEDRRVERTLELHGDRFDVGQRRPVVELRQQPQLTLRLGQRQHVTGDGRRGVPPAKAPRPLHRFDAALDRIDHVVDVGVGMRGREEAVAPLPDEHALLQEVERQQVQVARAAEPELRTEMNEPQWHAALLEPRIERVRQTVGTGIELALQLRRPARQLAQHGPRGDHREWVAVEGAREERRVGPGMRVVAVLPRAAVDPVEQVAAPGDGGQRQAAADHLAVGREVGVHAEELLRAAEARAKAGEHLVEHERDAVLAGQPAQVEQEFAWLQVGPPALDRLDENRRQLAGVRAQRSQR